MKLLCLVSLVILGQSAKVNVCQTVLVVKLPSLVSAYCTTPMVCTYFTEVDPCLFSLITCCQ